jgi:hypothetical protein
MVISEIVNSVATLLLLTLLLVMLVESHALTGVSQMDYLTLSSDVTGLLTVPLHAVSHQVTQDVTASN